MGSVGRVEVKTKPELESVRVKMTAVIGKSPTSGGHPDRTDPLIRTLRDNVPP